MKSRLALLLFAAALGRGEIIDRLVASVGRQVVTESEIRRYLKVDAFLSRTQPDFSPASRRKTALLLVRQALVRQEIEVNRYTVPVFADVEQSTTRLREERGEAEPAFERALAASGLEPRDLDEAIGWQLTFLRFIDFRFRPGAMVTQEEVRAYYEGDFKASLARATPGAEPPPLEEVTARITGILSDRKIDQLLEEWLKQAESSQRVRIVEEALQ
jgi:hypothetical protein